MIFSFVVVRVVVAFVSWPMLIVTPSTETEMIMIGQNDVT